MANKEQRNKDKANMKKKAEKRSAASPSSPASHATFDLSPALLALLDAFELKASTALAHLTGALTQLSLHRLSPALLDPLSILLTPTSPPVPLSSLATIQHRSPTQLLVTLYDPAHVKPVQKALAAVQLPGVGGLSPQVEGSGDGGEGVRLVVGMGKAGKEGKEEMKSGVKKKGEEMKGQVRAFRQAALTGVKKAEGTDEERERAKGRLQAMVDETIAEVDRRVREKEKEITEA